MISTIAVGVQFLHMNVLNYAYCLYLGSFVFLGSYFGITQVNRIVKLTGRQSVIVISLTVVLIVSMIMLPMKYII